MNQKLSLVFSLFLLAGIITPAYAQTSDGVVINEVDINPPGDDSKSISEWVELYNPTDSEIDLSGWQIASTTVLKKTMTIGPGTTIEPGQFLTFSYQSVWFTDINESVELRNANGIVIDKTPILSDIQNDFTSWQRIYDGYDLDNSNDWKFVTSTSGSTNGKLIQEQQQDEISVTLSSDKSSYLFGETAVITGSVSEAVFVEKPFFQPEVITVKITGPNFDRTLTLYPDLNLNFKTTLGLQKVLGINEGDYNITASYAGSTANTSFSVGYEIFEQEQQQQDGSLRLTTDKSQYIPGQMVTITGTATDIIEFQGMKFTVTDSSGNTVYNGNLFPVNGQFKTSIFLSTVNPVYGTYEIIGEYFDKSAITTFEVVKDVKETVPISLWTDKDVYGTGEVVTITGRLNDVWVASLDLEIIQTKSLSLGTGSQLGGGNVLKILDVVRMDGDGKFKYSFTIPDADTRLGDYTIKVSKDLGSAKKTIVVVEDPENYIPLTDPLIVTTNKLVYDFTLDNELVIRGQIKNPVERTSFETPVVLISFKDADGKSLSIIGVPGGINQGAAGGEGSVTANYEFTAIPESGGTFSVTADISRGIFSEGTYFINAQYLDLSATTSFDIVDDLNSGAGISLDKDVYGLGEKVTVSGIFPTAESSVTISVTRPDGTKTTYGTSVDNQRFSWSWTTPVSERYQTLKIDDGRDVTKSNFGIYKIKVSGDSYSKDLLFKVSADPENDSISTTPIFVTTDKSLYQAGDKLKVIGNVIPREQGDEGLNVPDRVTIKVLDGKFPYEQIHEASVYPKQGGEFSSLFELPPTIFGEGLYTVKAIYSTTQTTSTFSVANDFVFGLDEPVSLLASTDKSEYYPGDTVIISGKPNKLIYLEAYDVSIIKKSDTEITCGSFICGIHVGQVTSIRPSPSGSFIHEFPIKNILTSIGTYEVTIDADFETKHIKFKVVEELPAPKLETVIEKENRIPDTTISVSTQGKTVGDVSLSPRVVSGSLLTPIRDDASDVNLKVSSQSGVCIIGPDTDCLVSESTRKPGQIYDVVEVDGMSLNVRYSGPDVRLEKFSILPESSDLFLPDSNWNVEVLKDEQVSRFYYKVTYRALE
ncbi:lamin tail domain-containing protein [Candidatus Nitrosopumilus sp. SW]|uniref:lamin tail domain-containing protein n=1 Tax=Candidatus Nitrosopumilus sp. SW TaxID=2508726 RepID=UPI001150144A|nr:lamin tail domain-containing protein [Candidatus Nitrosopumilus sp. SW]QDI88361.1 lamin tail domain-containing protein [Candidatus Nitrosopumilus sp. SW]